MCGMFLFFFFSSRRRHTRLQGDWSSDVCSSDLAEVREAMDVLFGLLTHIDKGNDDVIFFADEGGSWQVGVDWARVLPVWFKVLSATAEPEEYAERITAMISRHYSHDRDKMLALAHRTATPGQRKALAEVKSVEAKGL